jgi:hypothetical protein
VRDLPLENHGAGRVHVLPRRASHALSHDANRSASSKAGASPRPSSPLESSAIRYTTPAGSTSELAGHAAGCNAAIAGEWPGASWPLIGNAGLPRASFVSIHKPEALRVAVTNPSEPSRKADSNGPQTCTGRQVHR